MSTKINLNITVDLAEGTTADAGQTVLEALARVRQGVMLGETAGTSRTSAWEITRTDGSPVLSLDEVIEQYLDVIGV